MKKVIWGILFLVLVGFVTHKVLLKTSNPYNEMFDKRAYAKLVIALSPDNLKEFHHMNANGLYVITREDEDLFNENIFENMSYHRSKWKERTSEQSYNVRFHLNNSPGEVVFSHKGPESDEFAVYYNDRYFYVTLPELHHLITDKFKVVLTDHAEAIGYPDFVYRLVSEQEQYKEDESIRLYAEIEYVGPEERITIEHQDSPFSFTLIEQTRGEERTVKLPKGNKTSTLLKRGEPYRVNYEISTEENLSTGDYVVSGSVAYFYQDTYGDSNEAVNSEVRITPYAGYLTALITFKVGK